MRRDFVLLLIALGVLLAFSSILINRSDLTPDSDNIDSIRHTLSGSIEVPKREIRTSGKKFNVDDPQETGPIRFTLKLKPREENWKDTGIQIELKNDSPSDATFVVLYDVLNATTFVIRNSVGERIGRFCPAYLCSITADPDIVKLNSGESEVVHYNLWPMIEYAKIKVLNPGDYTLEAVFHNDFDENSKPPSIPIIAKSNRVAFQLSEKDLQK